MGNNHISEMSGIKLEMNGIYLVNLLKLFELNNSYLVPLGTLERCGSILRVA